MLNWLLNHSDSSRASSSSESLVPAKRFFETGVDAVMAHGGIELAALLEQELRGAGPATACGMFLADGSLQHRRRRGGDGGAGGDGVAVPAVEVRRLQRILDRVLRRRGRGFDLRVQRFDEARQIPAVQAVAVVALLHRAHVACAADRP